MFKRNTLLAFILSAPALATICLLALSSTAQKGPSITTGAPLKGVDVKLGKNPGGNARAQILHANDKGEVDLSFLTPGSYYLELVLSEEQKAANLAGDYPYLAVTISGSRLVGGKRTRSWKIGEQQFVNPPAKTAKTTTAPEKYTNRILFDIGPEAGGREAGGHAPPEPCHATIVRSKSNISNN